MVDLVCIGLYWCDLVCFTLFWSDCPEFTAKRELGPTVFLVGLALLRGPDFLD
jgi:hypothetical protein